MRSHGPTFLGIEKLQDAIAAQIGRDILWLGALALATFLLYQCGGIRDLHRNRLTPIRAAGRMGSLPRGPRGAGTYGPVPTGFRYHRT